MIQEQAVDIALNWKYNGIYSFYNIQNDEEDMAEFLDPKLRGNSYFVVYSKVEAVGFYLFHQSEPNIVDIGLGMRPDLTGKGHGLEFIKAGLEFAKNEYSPQTLTLSVAAFNTRAITVYERAGFKFANRFKQDTNGGLFEFVKMIHHFNE